MKKLKSGNVVSTAKHSHKMTIHEVLPKSKAICDYFINLEHHREIHDLKDLTVILN